MGPSVRLWGEGLTGGGRRDPTEPRLQQKRDLLQLVVVDAHEGHLCAAALVELVAAGLAAKALEQQLSAEVAEGQREEGLPHLKAKDKQPISASAAAPPSRGSLCLDLQSCVW